MTETEIVLDKMVGTPLVFANNEKSTHRVEVVSVNLEPHPNADRLSINRVFGFTVCCRTDLWQDRKVAAWIPPDTLVPITRPEWDDMAGETRYNKDCVRAPKDATPEQLVNFPYTLIKARKLRGVPSYGMMVPAPADSKLGDNVADQLEVVHYEPPLSEKGADATSGPTVYSSKYDVDSFQRYAQQVFVPGEPVYATEKIHGESGRWVYENGKFHAGSRTEWKIDAPHVPWWKALYATPILMEFLESHPGIVVYGEVYGAADLKYGVKPGVRQIAVFDIMDNGRWLNRTEAMELAGNLPWVPLVAEMPYDFDKLVQLAEGKSLLAQAQGASHVREGVVVSPITERNHPTIGRVKLKIVGLDFLTRK